MLLPVARRESWSRGGQRVILVCTRQFAPGAAVGSNQFGDEIMQTCVQSLTIIGLLGIVDPPRSETARPVSDCRRAGSGFFTIAGDFGLTAAAIGRQVGIITNHGEPDSLCQVERRMREVDAGGDNSGNGGNGSGVGMGRIQSSLALEGKDLIQLTQRHWYRLPIRGDRLRPNHT